MSKINKNSVHWLPGLRSTLVAGVSIILFAGGNDSHAQQPQESTDPYYTPRTELSQANQPAPKDSSRSSEYVSSIDKPITGASPDHSGLPPLTPKASSPLIDTDSVSSGQLFEQGRVLARVGGYPIFVADLTLEARQILDQHIQDAPESIKQQEMAKLIPRLLPKYIQAKLLYVDVVGDLPETANLEEIMKTASEQFDESVMPKLMEKAGVESQVMLDAHYRALGSSLRRTREAWAENELVKYMVRSKINTDPEVSHREIYDTYISERNEKWSVVARVRWERLAVRLDRFSTRQQAWDALADMGNEVVYGAPLAAVSKRGSHDPMASQGGEQGWTNLGSLADKKLENELFSMALNELSDIRETDRGLEIVRVLDREEAGFISFEKAQPEIRKQLLETKQEAEFQRYADQVRERIPVEIFE